jgi:hypothetical protein
VGLVTGLLGLPLAPVRGVIWLAEQILEQPRLTSTNTPRRPGGTVAEEQHYDPARIRAQLGQVDETRRSGELAEEECVEIENGAQGPLWIDPGVIAAACREPRRCSGEDRKA